MNIAAINEDADSSQEEELKKDINCLLSLKNMYTSAFQQLGKNQYQECEVNFRNLINLINEKEAEKNNFTRFDIASFKKIKFACYKQLSVIYVQTHRLKERIDVLVDATRIDQEDISLWYDLAVCAYNDFNLYLSIESFTKVLEINIAHSHAFKYLILLHCVIYNFSEILKLLMLYLCRSSSQNVGIFIISAIIHLNLSEKFTKKLYRLLKKHKVNYNPKKPNQIITTWFANQFTSWNSYFQRIPPNLYFSEITVQISAIDISSGFRCLCEKISTLLDEYLIQNNCKRIECPNLLPDESIKTLANIDFLKRQYNMSTLDITSNGADIKGLTKKRSDRSQNVQILDSFEKSLLDILSNAQITITSDTSYNQQIKQTIDSVIQSTENGNLLNQIEIQVVKDFCKYIGSSIHHVFIDLALEMLRIIIIQISHDLWNLSLCYFFLNMCNNLFFRMSMTILDFHSYEQSVITAKIYLRYLEIYVFLIKQKIPVSEVNDFYNRYITLCIDQLTKFQLLSHTVLEDSILKIRIYWCLSHYYQDSNIKLSLSYLKVCEQNMQQPVIALFDIVEIEEWRRLISISNINEVSKNIKSIAKISESSGLLLEHQFKEILEIFSDTFYKDDFLLLSLNTQTVTDYLKIVLQAYLSLSKVKPYFLQALHVLKLLFFKELILFIDITFINETLISIFDKIDYNIEELDHECVKSLLLIILRVLNSPSISDNLNIFIHCLIYITHIVELLIESSLLDQEKKSDVYSQYVAFLHVNLIKKKLCCTEIARPLINKVIKEIFKQLLNLSEDSPIKERLRIYAEALLFCLIGFPSFRKISQNVDFIKDHPTGCYDKSIMFKDLVYFKTAYSYLKPTHVCNFSILIENFGFEVKKNQISTEMIKFYTFYANSVSSLVKDSEGKSVLELIPIYEECVFGFSPWPSSLINEKYTNFKAHIWNTSFDFSVFLYLFENSLRSTLFSLSTSLNWVIFSVITQPYNYLSWWAIASYCVMKIEDDINSLKNQNISNKSISLTNIISSAFFAYKKCLQLIDDENLHKYSILTDYGWLCFNVSSLLRNEFSLDRKFFTPEKLSKISLKCFLTVINELKFLKKNEILKYHAWIYNIYVKKCSYHIEKASCNYITPLLKSVDYFLQLKDLDIYNVVGLTELVSELCYFIMKYEKKDEILENSLDTCLAFITRFESQFSSSKTNITKNEAIVELIDEEASQNLLQSEPVSQIEDSPIITNDADLILPKEGPLLFPTPWWNTSFVGLCYCLIIKPYNYKYLIKMSQFLLELSKFHSPEYTKTFNSIIISLLTGKTGVISKLPPSILTKTLLLLTEKSNHHDNQFIGLFTLSNRINIFRKAWKLNNRFEGFMTFQKYMFKGIYLLCEVLSKQKEIKNLTLICAQLSKERSNTYLNKDNRMKVIQFCKTKIIEELHVIAEGNSDYDTILIVCYKLNKMPTKLFKSIKEVIQKMAIDAFSKINSSTPPSSDPKNQFDVAMKYAYDLDNIKK